MIKTMAPKKKSKSIKKDIMDSILTGESTMSKGVARELDCMIYRNGSDSDDPVSPESGPNFWEATKGNISVQVWEEKAKIRVKVSPHKKGNISMKRIASIAVDAILEELKKED